MIKPNIPGVVRQVVWPYDVFEKDSRGKVKIDPYSNKPEVDKLSTWTARVISLLASITAISVALEEATGYSIPDLIERFL